MSSDDILQQYEITLRLGSREFPPSAGASAAAAAHLSDFNRTVRLDGLSDDLNPLVLDSRKADAFLARLATVPASTLNRLRKRKLLLSDPALQLTSSSPVSAETLDKHYTLSVDDATRPIARARLDANVDEKGARERADRARQAMLTADRDVTTLADSKQRPDATSSTFIAHSTAERRRYAAATVWRDLLSALAQRHPDDRALQAEAASAKEAAAKYIVAPATGMPG